MFEERFWRATSTPIFDPKGVLACIAHRTEDVTASTRLASALLESQREVEAERLRLQTIIDTVPTGLIMLNERGGSDLENAEWKRTWAGDDVVNRVVDADSYKGFRPDTGERISAQEWPSAMSLERGISCRGVVLDIERFDGTPGTILVSSAPIRDGDGRVIGAVAANMDISELRTAQARLQLADQRKDEFLAMLAHELRNPLAPVAIAAELLQRNSTDPISVRKNSAIISRQVRHLVKLIDDLMDVSRVTRGLVNLDLVELDTNQTILVAVEQLRPVLEARGQALTLQLTSEQVLVRADAARLIQVLTNVLANAVKYSSERGRITIGTWADASSVKIWVADNGQGMPPDLVKHCFDMSVQGTRSSDRSAGGLGIGLALVKSLVELQGGSVKAESEGEGAGSRFTVVLPRFNAATRRELTGTGIAATTLETLDPCIVRPCVLIVDDNKDAADTIGMLMEALGYTPVVEYHPLRALERLLAVAPDLCLLDIGLPDMSGYELAREIRKRLAPSKVTLIGITGYGQPQDREAALQAGFDEHLIKPIESERLMGMLARIPSVH